MAKGFLYDEGDALITRTEDVLPDTDDASAGDVLSLDEDKKPAWSTPESGLPGTGTASAGDVLTLDEDKEPVWSAPSGGGGTPMLMAMIMNGQISFFDPNSQSPSPLTYSELAELGQFNFSAILQDMYGSYSPVCFGTTAEEDSTLYLRTSEIVVGDSDYLYIMYIDDSGITAESTAFYLSTKMVDWHITH